MHFNRLFPTASIVRVGLAFVKGTATWSWKVKMEIRVHLSSLIVAKDYFFPFDKSQSFNFLEKPPLGAGRQDSGPPIAEDYEIAIV